MVNVIFDGDQEMEGARKGVGVLLNDVWHSSVVKSGCVSSLKFSGLNSSFQELKFMWWWVTAPM